MNNKVKKLSKKLSKKFQLDINYKQVEIKYNINNTSTNEQKTYIKEIISDNNAISFIYRNNNLNCKISNIRYGQENCYNCYWCRNPIEATIVPIGCPIKYIPSNVYKTYNSEINKNNYIMKEDLYINNLSKIIIKQNDEHKSLITNNKDYYITDGIFCSFNCAIAYINEHSNNPMYNNSKMLLLNIFNKIYNRLDVIIPAPHWRTLKEYGGNKSIEQFRKCFNKIDWKSYGNTIIDNRMFSSTSFLYEEYFKL